MTKRIIAIVITLVLGVASFAVVSNWASDPENYKSSYASIEKTEKNALAIAATATTAATIAAAIPGEAATPVANKLADIAGYTVIIFVAIMIEKYLLTLTGALAFKILIPIGAIIIILGLLFRDEIRRKSLYQLAAKVMIVGLLLWALVPISVKVTDVINTTYEQSSVITIEDVSEDQGITAEAQDEAKTEEESKDDGTIKGKFSSWLDKAKTTTSAVVEKGLNEGKSKLEPLKDKITDLIEKVAVMIVTTCVIPVCVLLLGIWIIKTVFNLNIAVRLPKASKLLNKKQDEVAETVTDR